MQKDVVLKSKRNTQILHAIITDWILINKHKKIAIKYIAGPHHNDHNCISAN